MSQAMTFELPIEFGLSAAMDEARKVVVAGFSQRAYVIPHPLGGFMVTTQYPLRWERRKVSVRPR